MIRHIVLWNFREELSAEERKEAGKKIWEMLLTVKEQAQGVLSLEVVNGLSSSNRDLGLIAVFESEAALNAYQVHPAHVKAGAYIKTVTCDRVCLDYEPADVPQISG